MDCPSCGRSNRPGARFCGGCGSSLAPRCPACGAMSVPDARFCDACGAPLAASGERSVPPASGAHRERPAEKAIARKVVTVVFADLIGSVALHERLDAESARRFVDRYHRAMTAAVEVHGGKVVQLLGDGVLAAFGVPRVAEDDAIRAVRAGVGMQRAFRELMREQRAAQGGVGLRVAVNTGEVVVSDDETAVIGDPTNVAARLQHEARDGDVLVGEGTQRLVGDRVTLAPLGSFALKGRSEMVTAWRVVSLDRPAGARTTAFVGRDEELRRIAAVYEAAVAGPSARMVALLGSPGLGKSRLVAEFTQRASQRATVLAARCDAAGGATFAPIAEALRAFLRIEEGAGGDVLRAAIDAVVPGDEAERGRIATGIGALFSGAPSSPEETFFAVRRLLAALATVRPVVLVIDDLHWAEPLLFDLVEHLVQWSAGVPLFLLVAARPELREGRSSLATPGPLVADVVMLGGLDAAASMRLAAGVVGAPELPAALVGRVLATSEGNPLFLRELIRMLVQDGTLAREGERWITTVEVAKLDMPPTIQVLLAARIERLRPEERSVLERAAVIGRVFSRASVAHLLGPTPDLDARLEALRRSELIETDTGWYLGEPALRFHHVLIRDAAYRRVLKKTRAELHEKLADWVIARAGESVEHDETIGFHLEHAHQNRLELGLLDPHGRALGERAARRLGAAGRRALARDDLALAAGLLGRALARLDPQDPARADLALDWCEALLAAGEVGPARHAIAELARFASSSERLRAWHACFTGQLAVLTDPQSLRAAAETVAAAAESLSAAGDVTGEAKAHSVHALVLAQLGKIGACEAALDRALAAARRARERRLANAVLAGAPLAALWGPSPVTRASGRCLDVVRVLRITQGAPAVEAVALRCQAVLETLRGRGEAARRMIAASRTLVEELGIAQQVLEADLFAGLIELLERDAAAAERWLRPAWDGLRAQGLGIDAAQAGALLARALLAQGRIDEADRVSLESESLAGDSFKAVIAWRGVRAEVLAARGEHGGAIELARAAVEIAAATDDLLDHADARAALAVALRASGRSAEADAEERRAVELWEAKGASLLVECARCEAAPSARSASAPLEAAASPRAARRRVQANDATRHLALVDAAVAARDLPAVERLLGEIETFDHTAGQAYRPHEVFRFIIERYADPTFANEPIATLGRSLALARFREAGSELLAGDLPMGPFELEGAVLIEADSQPRATRVEVFAADKVGDAVARLYERYAERLPEGPERDRAGMVARTIGAYSGPLDVERFSATWAPDVEYVDRRRIGMGSARGVAALRRIVESLIEAAPDTVNRVDDVLALRPDAWLRRTTNLGTDRTTGGAYERSQLMLTVNGPDGLVTRVEQFDPECEAEALARFDASSGGPPTRSAQRRIAANAATALLERSFASLAAGDREAFASVRVADDVEVFHHATGTTFDRAGIADWWRAYFADRDVTFHGEPLAALGPSLALARLSWSGGASDDPVLSIGAFEAGELDVLEVDAAGRVARIEVYASDRLGDAVPRLYERRAELLPEGPERDRAATTARSVAAAMQSGLRHGPAGALSSVELVDHRTLGAWSARGADAILDDVLALAPSGLVVRWTTSGTDRASGGACQRGLLMLCVFGADGLLSRCESFDPGSVDAALARFDALTALRQAVRRRVHANAATALQDRMDAAIAARDADALASSFSEDFEHVDHATGASYGRDGALESHRSAFEIADLARHPETLATLGDALALFRTRWSGSGAGGSAGFGAWELENLVLLEVDARGNVRRTEHFAENRLGDAVVRLYERHAERLPAGPERLRAAATARSAAVVLGSIDDVLALRSDAVLVRVTSSGTTNFGGGTQERPFLLLWTFGADGLVARSEQFDLDHDAQALARFDELSAGVPAASRIENAATRSEDAYGRAWGARDWDAVVALYHPDFRSIDRRPLMHLEVDRDTILAAMRPIFEMVADRPAELLATRGERLALYRLRYHGSAGVVGPSEVEILQVLEVDADGLRIAAVAFDPDDLDAAYAELDARWQAGDAEAHHDLHRREAPRARFAELRPPLRIPPNAATRAAVRREQAIAEEDWETIEALAAPALVFEDRRRGSLTSGDREMFLANDRLVAASRPRISRTLLATAGDRLALSRLSIAGSYEAVEFETELLHVVEVDGDGRVVASLAFDPGDRRAASVEMSERFRRGEGQRIPAAAREGMDALLRHDFERIRAALPEDFVFHDHRRTGLGRLVGGAEFVDSLAPLAAQAPDFCIETLYTVALGEHGMLDVARVFGTLAASGGAFEVCYARLATWRGEGSVALELFEPEDLGRARARFEELAAAAARE